MEKDEEKMEKRGEKDKKEMEREIKMEPDFTSLREKREE